MRFSCLILAACITLSPTLAFAAITEDQVQGLKKGLQDFLDYQRDVNQTYGSVIVQYDGDLSLVQNGDMLNVTLPKITLKGIKEGDQNVELGVITANAVPDEKPGLWKMSLTLPGAIKVTEAGEPDFTVNIAGQSAIGVFHQALGYFTKFDLNLMNVTANENGQDLGFNLAKFAGNINLEESADGLLSGPTYIHLEDMALKDEDSYFKIGKIALDGSIDKMKPISLQAYKEKVMKHKDTFEVLAKLEQSKEGDDAVEGQKVVDMLFDLYDFSMEGFNGRLSVENVDIETRPSAEEPVEGVEKTVPEEPEKFRLANASIGMEFSGMGGDSGMMKTSFGYAGATMLPMDPQYDGIMPTDMNFTLSNEKLPMKSLYALLRNTATSATQNPEMASMAGMGLLIKLPALLAQAGSTLSISDTFVQGGLYKASLDGKLLTDLAALTSFTGKFDGVFDGLDELLTKLKTNEKAEDSYNPEEYAELAATLEQIKSYGKAQSGGARSAYTYAMELTADGRILVNGKEVTFGSEEGPASIEPSATPDMPTGEMMTP